MPENNRTVAGIMVGGTIAAIIVFLLMRKGAAAEEARGDIINVRFTVV